MKSQTVMNNTFINTTTNNVKRPHNTCSRTEKNILIFHARHCHSNNIKAT